MAHLVKRLCLPVGQYQKEGSDKISHEYREIGTVWEFERDDGTTFQEVRLNLDILNPQLFALARSLVAKGSSTARVKMFDGTAKPKTKPAAEAEPNPNPKTAADAEDDIPF